VVPDDAPHAARTGDGIMNAREDSIGYYDSGVRRRWLFEDRADAGKRLADALVRYRGRGAVVLAIPRGGVPVAAEVARRLDADLDVIVARKLGAPGQSELAIGAVAADGSRWLNRELVGLTGASDAYLHAVADEQRREAERRERRFRAGLAPFDPVNRIAIVVDDGLATGATMRAALRSLRRRGAQRLVAAVPVGSADACESISADVDELVCPHRPDPFYAVGQHYAVFDQTSDEEVELLLREQRERRARSAAPAHSAR
jgi:predicted phosphoribosyltransferase